MDALPPILSGGEKQRAADRRRRGDFAAAAIARGPSRPAMSIRRWGGDCCGCSSS